MVVQVTAILLLLLSRPLPALRVPGLVALAVVVAVTLVSGGDYFRRFWSEVRAQGGGRRGARQPRAFEGALRDGNKGTVETGRRGGGGARPAADRGA